jgi:hypothetical protein
MPYAAEPARREVAVYTMEVLRSGAISGPPAQISVLVVLSCVENLRGL